MHEAATIYLDVNDVESLLNADNVVILIDARTAEEFAGAHVPGAINVPIASLTDFGQDHRDAAGKKDRGGDAEIIQSRRPRRD